jgi:hypothetical protein
VTRREFDLETKRQGGGGRLCRGERHDYRVQRLLPSAGSGSSPPTDSWFERDRLAERAELRRLDPATPTLGRGSPLRAPTSWRLLGRLP